MQLSSKLVSAVFPEFHGVASYMAYTLHPTTFYQSGVHRNQMIVHERFCSTLTNVLGFIYFKLQSKSF